MPDQKMHETLITKADHLLKIKQVREIYENILPCNEQFRPENEPIYNAFLISLNLKLYLEVIEIKKCKKV